MSPPVESPDLDAVDAGTVACRQVRVLDDGSWAAYIKFDGPLELARDVARRYGCAVGMLPVLAPPTPEPPDVRTFVVVGPYQGVFGLIHDHGVWSMIPDSERLPLAVMLASVDAAFAVEDRPDPEEPS